MGRAPVTATRDLGWPVWFAPLSGNEIHFAFCVEASAMIGQRVSCPACKSVLMLPGGHEGKRVRCGRCHHAFATPRHETSTVTEEDIAHWLEEEDEEELAAGAATPPPGDLSRDIGPDESAAAPVDLSGRPIRVVTMDRHGVLLEFPVSRLRETAFRCAMPRQCLRCGSQAHLQAHVIRYSVVHPQSGNLSLKAEHAAGDLVLSHEQAHGLAGEELLQRLPEVPNVPEPGNLPMPYWICENCTASGVISGQIQVNTATGKGRCRLLIQSLVRAEEFFLAAGGKDTDDAERLDVFVQSMTKKPWDRLPNEVKDRIKQWFTPENGESFVAYIPDRDRTRTEDGVAGLLVSTHRLIYHTQMRHRELPKEHPLELQLGMTGVTGTLRINAGDWRVKHFAIDRDGVRRLRRALAAAKFRARWR